MTSDNHDEYVIMPLRKKQNKRQKLQALGLIVSSCMLNHWNVFLTLKVMYSGCSLTVSDGFCHQYRRLHFIIACWEFPSVSIHCWPPLCVRVCEGWPSPSNAARLKDQLVLPHSVDPSALRLHCSALLGARSYMRKHFFMAIYIWKTWNQHTPSFSPMWHADISVSLQCFFFSPKYINYNMSTGTNTGPTYS